MIKELLKEEEGVKRDFELFIKKEPEIETIKSRTFLEIKEILENVVKKSDMALKECQLIESLDKQLRLISDTQKTLKRLNRLNQLNSSILRPETELSEIVPLILEWKSYDNSELLGLSETSEIVQNFINEKLPERIDQEICSILSKWTDDSSARDQESISLLSSHLRLESTNPLHCLFASYPLSKLKLFLTHQITLGNGERQFTERLLNRFYDILQSDGSALSAVNNTNNTSISTVGTTNENRTQPFSVGQIEVLVPEKMKFATRISCILEATFNFIKLHPNLRDNFMKKCGQITRQIRKCAKEERGYERESGNAATLDANLNEISLIITTMSNYQNILDETLNIELKKWEAVYFKLEEIYLVKGIQKAIEIDQIVAGESNSEFPVSSCVDDIFYVLQSAKSRISQIQNNSKLISNSLRDFFLNVLKKHLEISIQNLKPLNLLELQKLSSFKPSKELITTLVLTNNIIATRSNWRAFTTEQPVDPVEQDLKNILNFALNGGIYSKVLQTSVKRELQQVKTGEELFIKIHSLLTIIHNLFKVKTKRELRALIL